MVKRLYIKNFAVIDFLTIDFGNQLNVLSGETGAGKSIIIESINFLFGRTKGEGVNVIRSGEDEAYISCLFNIGSIEEKKIINDIFLECGVTWNDNDNDDEILIKKTINTAGKIKYFINNERANKSVIDRLNDHLLNIFGQNDKKFLISSESQLAFLDNYAGDVKYLYAVRDLYRDINSLKAEKKIIEKKIIDISRIRTINSYIISDVERLDISSYKDEDNIKDELKRLENINKIKEYVLSSKNILDNDSEDKDNSILKNLNSVIIYLQKLTEIDPQFKETEELKNAQDARLLLEDILISLERRSSFEFDEERLNTLRVKLDLIITIENKHGVRNLKELLDVYNNAKNEMSESARFDDRLQELAKKIEEKKIEYINIAQILHKKRIESSANLEKEIVEELAYLGIRPIFKVKIDELNFDEGFSETGLNIATFMFSANVGEAPKPLDKIASGGELSRVSLCMLKAVNSKKNAGTFIFDEIDSGIGGEVGGFVGDALRKISKNTQVICITHLAQVASCAEKHFFIYKIIKDGRTYTTIKDLNLEERVFEIARMLSGSLANEAAINHAKEILRRRGFIV